jgi:UDP-hydrolysing UDP-N-acetyl-D-glucosamine 2-epimerase
MAQGMERAFGGMSRVLSNWRPDLLLVLGHRYEMFAGALATVPFHVPVAHLHGGEVSSGALDDSFRHALSKLSHLHFAATPAAARRLRRMGEESWRITVSGAPALDRFHGFKPLPMDLPGRFLLVTYHPVTREPGEEGKQVEELVRALRRLDLPCVVTAPNADPGWEVIERRLRRFCAQDTRSKFLKSAGADGYFTLLSRAAAMVGNSSSGLLEAPSFGLPVVNVGSRQDGRERGRNVIDCDPDEEEIVRAIRRALNPRFRRSLRGRINPYGDGRAAERIVRRLESVPLGPELLRKEFSDR